MITESLAPSIKEYVLAQKTSLHQAFVIVSVTFDTQKLTFLLYSIPIKGYFVEMDNTTTKGRCITLKTLQW